jgi:hypothetical protein
VARAETGRGPERTARRGTHGLGTSRDPGNVGIGIQVTVAPRIERCAMLEIHKEQITACVRV